MNDQPAGTDDRTRASILRHDLIVPINQIIGYADLLIEDAETRGEVYRVLSLRSIRNLGRQSFEAIDQALLRQTGTEIPLESLGKRVVPLSDAIIEACRALEDVLSRTPTDLGFREDLEKIREAASLLAGMARQVARGEIPVAGQAGPSSESSSNGNETGPPIRADR